AKNLILDTLNSIQKYAVDCLFICIDAEKDDVIQRRREVEEVLQSHLPLVTTLPNYAIVIQNRTMETWFLGNRALVQSAQRGEELLKCLDFYNVEVEDPELLPIQSGHRNHAKYHLHYLRQIFLGNNLRYQKNNPREVMEESYLCQLIQRVQDTTHLPEFKHFLQQCQQLGAIIPCS
ncbi:MAG: hypothetical protein HQL55_11825, partial [Magnetococcales bacterium]|nr:hypothetical protein [Magnetococcales bacterium]